MRHVHILLLGLMAAIGHTEETDGAFLYVTSTPDSAAVTADGTVFGAAPCRIPVTVGADVSVTVSRSGYRTQRHTIAVRSLREHLEVSLEPASGALGITSSPSGGTVYLNGNRAGTTPLQIDNIRCGTYDIRLTLEGYTDFTGRAEVTTDIPATVNAVFAQYGALFVESEPLGAAIYLDGARAGTTPARLSEIPSGPRAVRVVREGYEPFETRVTVTANTQTTVTAALHPGYGSLPVTSDPTGAGLALDGTPRGRTPAELSRIPYGSHALRVSLPGYADTTVDLRITGTTSPPLRVLLSPLPARLVVTMAEPDAQLLVDGSAVPDGKHEFVLPPGRHTVTATHPSYAAVVRDVTLAPGRVTDLRMAFEHRTRLAAAARSAVLPGWGQYRGGHTEKAFFIWALQGAGITAAAVTYARTADASRVFDSRDRAYYDNPGDATAADRSDAYDRLATERRRFMITAGLALAVWGLNVGDALFVPARSERGFGLEAGIPTPAAPAAVALRYRF